MGVDMVYQKLETSFGGLAAMLTAARGRAQWLLSAAPRLGGPFYKVEDPDALSLPSHPPRHPSLIA